MKLGYFSHTNLNVTETFIYDLIKDLNKENDIDLTYYSGRNTGSVNVDFDLKSILTGYSEAGEKPSYRAFKIGQMLGSGKGYAYKMALQKRVALSKLLKRVKLPMDYAFVEYANSAILLREYFKIKKIPFIVHVHGYDITSSLNDPQFALELKHVLQEAKYLVTASQHMKRLLILQGADEKKIRVIHYGIDVESMEPLSWEERRKESPRVIFIGSLREKKHPIALLHAFKLVLNRIPNAKLTIIGDGVLRKSVEERIVMLGLTKSVDMLGFLSREKSFPILNRHHVYAQHSVTDRVGDQEGYAISPAEAAAHEIPVVSTMHNGITEHVIDGVTGFLVQEFNFEMMAEKIIVLLNDFALCEQMGKKGRQNILVLNDQSKRIKSIKALFYE